MQTYLVGGAVRDRLLGLAVGERDYVVVGMSPKKMLAAGYLAVGRDFPVFLHPETHEEHALARTERKTGPGYQGFTFHTGPNITLEADLLRRDLTINAIAEDADGRIIDPHGGVADLENKILRHVSPAFAEDPVRVLRLARFAARFSPLGFTVAAETLELVRSMVAAGTVRELVAERVWQEFQRALMTDAPEVFVQTLIATDAWADIFPQQKDPDALAALLARAAADRLLLTPRFACAAYLSTDARTWCEELRVSRALKRAACQLQAHFDDWVAAETHAPAVLLALLERLDTLRRPESLELFLAAAHTVAGHQKIPLESRATALERAAEVVRNCDISAAVTADAADIKEQVRKTREAAIAAALT